jgi:hypothetical protein
MNTGYGRYGATYNMVGFSCFNEELSLLPKNPTEAKLQATSTRGESTEPTKGVMKHTSCASARARASTGKGIQIHGSQFNR